MSIIQYNSVQDGVFRLRFVAGNLALKNFQNNSKILKDLSNLYKVSNDAIFDNAKRIFTKRNSSTTQVRNISIELLEAQVEIDISKNYEKYLFKRNENNPGLLISNLQKNMFFKTRFSRNKFLCSRN
jgi:alanyl-tRNA synthetase